LTLLLEAKALFLYINLSVRKFTVFHWWAQYLAVRDRLPAVPEAGGWQTGN